MSAAPFRSLIVIALAATIVLCVPVEAAPEVENQDKAFSLLIEGYGEVQSAFIENDYQARLGASESIANSEARSTRMRSGEARARLTARETQAATLRDGRRLPLRAPNR